MTATDFGYCIFMVANKQCTNVFVRALLKSHVHTPEPYVDRSGCRLENCRATATGVRLPWKWSPAGGHNNAK